jgi:O-antigen/teichoic acid export membrane protein
VTLAVSLVSGAPRSTLVLITLFTVGLTLNSTAMLFEGLLKNAGRAGMAGVAIAGQSAVSLGVGVAALAGGVGVFTGALAYTVGAVVHLIGTLVWSRSLWRRAEVGDAPESAAGMLVAMIRESLPLAVTGIFIAIYFRLDSVMLNAMQGPHAVGLYGSAYRFFEAMVILSAAYRSVLFPFMSRRADGPSESLAVLCRKSFRLHLILTIGVAVLFTVLSPRLITLLLGREYLAASSALRILMWALPGAFMADMLLHLLVAQRRQFDTTRAVAVTAVFNVALNLILIPRFSIVGAAIATVASEMLSFGLMFVAFSRTVPPLGLARAVRAPLLAGLAAALVMSALGPVAPDGFMGLLASGSSGVLVYLLSLVGLGALRREDLALARSLIPAAATPESDG